MPGEKVDLGTDLDSQISENKAILKNLIGHQDQILHLVQSVSRSDSATFLLCGPKGIGKKMIARGVAQLLLCETGNGCGVCPSCHKIYLHKSESVLEISSENNLIKVESAHRILAFVGLQRIEKYRFIIIDEVQLMNTQAANSILKALEEPPMNTFYFLISSQRSKVLATFQSRSQIVLFNPLTSDQIQSKTGERDLALLKKSRGQFSKYYALCEDKNSTKKNALSTLWERFFQADFLLDHARDEFKSKDQFEELVGAWLELAYENIVSSYQQPDLQKFENQSTRPNLDLLFFVFAELNRIQRDQSFHVDPALRLEQLWVQVQNKSVELRYVD